MFLSRNMKNNVNPCKPQLNYIKVGFRGSRLYRHVFVMPCLCKQCRSRSVGFWRSQLIWICTVCHKKCEFVSTIWIKLFYWLRVRSGRGILIYSAWQGLSKTLAEPKHEKVYLLTCQSSKDLDQLAHPQSLTGVFAGHLKKLCTQRLSSKDSGKTA